MKTIVLLEDVFCCCGNWRCWNGHRCAYHDLYAICMLLVLQNPSKILINEGSSYTWDGLKYYQNLLLKNERVYNSKHWIFGGVIETN